MSDRFHWFRGSSVDALTAQLTAGPIDRLEVHQDGDSMTFVVVRKFEEATGVEESGTPINESHICPPDCG